MPKFSVIIVNYNSGNFLAELVDSFKALKLPVSEFEFIVVDNNSRDDSLSKVSWGGLDKRFILNKDNYGFARANNQGIRISRGEFIVLLNPDTRLLNDIFSIMEAVMLKDGSIGICGPGIYHTDGRPQLSYFSFPGVLRKVLVISGITDILLKWLLPKMKIGKFSAVPWISGACMMFKREVIDRVGFLDENFFAYVEDADFCLRARNAGYQVYYVPEAKIIHHLGWVRYVKKTKESLDAYFLSLGYFYRKHYKGLKKACLVFLNKIDWIINFLLTPKILLTMRCPICGREGEVDFIEFHKPYKIYECGTCKGQFCLPLDITADNYRDWYRGKSHDKISYESFIAMPADRAIENHRNTHYIKLALGLIRKLKNSKKLLEIGCSQGAFCKIAEGLGFDAYGVEPSCEAAGYAREKLGLKNVISASADDIPPDWRDFDIVASFEVLEHLRNPRALVFSAFSSLKPGGYLLLSVPNNNNLEIFCGRRDRGDYPPHHLTRWRRGTLTMLLEEAGFRGIAIKNTPIDRVIIGIILAHSLLLQRAQLLGLPVIYKKEEISGAKKAFLFSWVWLLAQRFGDLTAFFLNLIFPDKGSTLVVLARKPKEEKRDCFARH